MNRDKTSLRRGIQKSFNYLFRPTSSNTHYSSSHLDTIRNRLREGRGNREHSKQHEKLDDDNNRASDRRRQYDEYSSSDEKSNEDSKVSRRAAPVDETKVDRSKSRRETAKRDNSYSSNEFAFDGDDRLTFVKTNDKSERSNEKLSKINYYLDENEQDRVSAARSISAAEALTELLIPSGQTANELPSSNTSQEQEMNKTKRDQIKQDHSKKYEQEAILYSNMIVNDGDDAYREHSNAGKSKFYFPKEEDETKFGTTNPRAAEDLDSLNSNQDYLPYCHDGEKLICELKAKCIYSCYTLHADSADSCETRLLKGRLLLTTFRLIFVPLRATKYRNELVVEERMHMFHHKTPLAFVIPLMTIYEIRACNLNKNVYLNSN
jgi:hypothetical protein